MVKVRKTPSGADSIGHGGSCPSLLQTARHGDNDSRRTANSTQLVDGWSCGYLCVEGEIGDVDGTGAAENRRRNPEHITVAADHCKRFAMLLQPRIGAVQSHAPADRHTRGPLRSRDTITINIIIKFFAQCHQGAGFKHFTKRHV